MLDFLKNWLLRGLLILIPLVLLYLALREILELMIVVATPIVDLFPAGTFDTEHDTEMLAAGLIVISALVLGALASAGPVVDGARWLEDRTLNQLPMYRMLKSITAAFLGIQAADKFRPALLVNDDGSREPVYVVEDPGYATLVIMKPRTPTPFAGSIKIVPRRQVQFIAVGLDEYSLHLTHFGLGLADLVEQHTRNAEESKTDQDSDNTGPQGPG